jgi:hypothetical protein
MGRYAYIVGYCRFLAGEADSQKLSGFVGYFMRTSHFVAGVGNCRVLRGIPCLDTSNFLAAVGFCRVLSGLACGRSLSVRCWLLGGGVDGILILQL